MSRTSDISSRVKLLPWVNVLSSRFSVVQVTASRCLLHRSSVPRVHERLYTIYTSHLRPQRTGQFRKFRPQSHSFDNQSGPSNQPSYFMMGQDTNMVEIREDRNVRWVLLDVRELSRSMEFLDSVLASLGDLGTLYLAIHTGMHAGARHGFPSLNDLDILHEILRLVALRVPRLDVIPVFDAMHEGRKGTIVMPHVVYVSKAGHDATLAVEEFVSCCWEIAESKVEARVLEESDVDTSSGYGHGRVPMSIPQQWTRMILPDGTSYSHIETMIENRKRPFRFGTVAVGGTFDRFHAGHRLLLAATAMVADKAIFVGISSAKLLQNKNLKERLQSYQERTHAAVSFMELVNPALQITPGPLTDPSIPPLCATEQNFDAIVVSEETISGAHEINRVRQGLGFHPLVIIVVGLLHHDSTTKLSSSDLRSSEVDI